MTDSTSTKIEFPACRKRRVELDFAGGEISSNDGVGLLALAERQNGLLSELARADLFDYIEVFHNRKRRHGYLGNISPADFEERSTGSFEMVHQFRAKPDLHEEDFEAPDRTCTRTETDHMLSTQLTEAVAKSLGKTYVLCKGTSKRSLSQRISSTN